MSHLPPMRRGFVTLCDTEEKSPLIQGTGEVDCVPCIDAYLDRIQRRRPR